MLVPADDGGSRPSQPLDFTASEKSRGAAAVWRHLHGAALVRARDAAAVEKDSLEGARQGGGARALLWQV